MVSQPLQKLVLGNIFISETYFFTTSTFLVSPGKPYSSFEKLFFPFEVEVWIALIIVYGVALILIFALKFSSKLRDFVINRNVKTPIINLIIHTVGGNQTILPRNNFARYILMLFMLFCLVMR
jgi:hypothetical protein